MKTNTAIGNRARGYVTQILGVGTGLVLLLVLPAPVHAQFTYTSSGGAVTITGYNGPGGAVTIPNALGGLLVRFIGDHAFSGCTNITSVTLPSTIRMIGYYAFYQSTALTNVTMLDGITSINDFAFAECGNLTNIPLPDSVTALGRSAFAGCAGLTTLTIPNKVSWIFPFTFCRCASMVSITIPSSITNIDDYAFAFSTNLTALYFKGNAPSLGGDLVFSGDNNATVYYLPGTTGWGTTFGGRPTALWPPPAIQAPPQTQSMEAGGAAQFSVQALSAGDLALSYQWYFDGTNRLSGTNSVLQLAGVQSSQSGAYTVVVINAMGSVTSAPAFLNVIAPVERSKVPALRLSGKTGQVLNLDVTATLSPPLNWEVVDSVLLTEDPQWYLPQTTPAHAQRFFRVWQSGVPSVPEVGVYLAPALALSGAIGSSLRVDYINQFGPIDAWVTLATVTLTNTPQLYFDTSSIGQPPRLWRIVPVP